jgi:diguanylate cyclase (GGDEF)-like protein
MPNPNPMPTHPSSRRKPDRRFRHRWSAVGLANSLSRRPLFAGVAGTAVAILMAGLSIATLYQGRQAALDHACETSANLVAIISGDIARNVEIYNLSLQAIVDGAQNPAIMALPPDLRRQILFDRATTAAYIGGTYVLDARGKIVVQGTSKAVSTDSFADREYFRAHQRDPFTSVYFSHPYESRVRRGSLSIGMSRRINAADGSFGGVALLAVHITYFDALIDKLNLGDHGSIFIVEQDGTIIAHKPTMPGDAGRSIAKSPTFARMSQAAAGSYLANASVDGVRRIYTFARVPGTPFIAVVAPAEADVLASWRRRSTIVGSLTLLFGASFIVLSWLLALSLRERARAHGELVRLAGTDPLTGLPNRRAFDERIDEEWRRARRANTPLSVLFIDVDHFKLYNDTYGHALGDDALATVAESIGLAVRRPADVPARYGGEEFVVLLPDTSMAGAQQIAEAIRRRVKACGIAHRGSELGVVTVSIGCATGLPTALSGTYGLLSAADKQLYDAKAEGRDCVRPRVDASVAVAAV